MIIFKCKMCGGDLHPEENATTCECEYCGSVQTIPTADSEKKGIRTLMVSSKTIRISQQQLQQLGRHSSKLVMSCSGDTMSRIMIYPTVTSLSNG